MPLYLMELRVDVSTAQKRAAIFERVEQVIKQGVSPAGARLIAGPWASQETPTILVIFEHPDIAASLAARMEWYSEGLATDMQLRPIATWQDCKAAAAKVPGYL